MITINEAIGIIKEYLPQRRTESVKLSDAAGRILADEIRAGNDAPPYTNSAMDGFAVKWEDVEHTCPESTVTLNIIGESEAGSPFSGEADKGQALRINTGAIMPGGTDTVVPIEQCRVSDETVEIVSVRKKYQNVRYAGEEFSVGDLLLEPGKRLRSAEIALLASMGQSLVQVFARPRVAVVVTGSELVPHDQPAASHQLRDSNSPMIAAACMESGADPVLIERVGDSLQDTINMINKAEKAADIILFSGGVSVGPHDHVKPAAGAAGFKELFWKVRQKPGKPFFMARKENVLLFGLPGNPVSAFVCFSHYIKPLLRFSGGQSFHWSQRKAVLKNDAVNKGDRSQLWRVRLEDNPGGNPKAIILDRQASHMITTVSAGHGYIVAEENQEIKSGDEVNVYLY